MDCQMNGLSVQWDVFGLLGTSGCWNNESLSHFLPFLLSLKFNWQGKTEWDTHLVCTPVPSSHYSNPKHHSRPGQVPSGGVPQQAEGVLSGGVAVGGDVVAPGIHGGEITWNSRAVFGHQGAVASYFCKGLKWKGEKGGTSLSFKGSFQANYRRHSFITVIHQFTYRFNQTALNSHYINM